MTKSLKQQSIDQITKRMKTILLDSARPLHERYRTVSYLMRQRAAL